MKPDMNFAEARANRAASPRFQALCQLSLREEERLKVERYQRAAKELSKASVERSGRLNTTGFADQSCWQSRLQA